MLWTLDLDARGALAARRRPPRDGPLHRPAHLRRRARGRRWRCCARWASGARRSSASAAASRCRPPSRRSTPTARCTTARRCDVRALQRPALAAHRHGRRGPDARAAAPACCARCRPPSPRRSSACAASPPRSAATGRRRPTTATFIRSLDPFAARDAAILRAATGVLRGAGYVAFDGRAARRSRATPRSPRSTRTSPRRCAGSPTATRPSARWPRSPARPSPAGSASRLADLPAVMAAAERRARPSSSAPPSTAPRRRVARRPRRRDVRRRRDRRRAVVQLRDPAVRAPCDGDPPLGPGGRGSGSSTADPASRHGALHARREGEPRGGGDRGRAARAWRWARAGARGGRRPPRGVAERADHPLRAHDGPPGLEVPGRLHGREDRVAAELVVQRAAVDRRAGWPGLIAAPHGTPRAARATPCGGRSRSGTP